MMNDEDPQISFDQMRTAHFRPTLTMLSCNFYLSSDCSEPETKAVQLSFLTPYLLIFTFYNFRTTGSLDQIFPLCYWQWDSNSGPTDSQRGRVAK